MSRQSPFESSWFCDAESLIAQAPTPEARAAIRRLLELGKDYASLARQFLPAARSAPVDHLARLQQEFVERYRQSFAPDRATTDATAWTAGAAAAVARYQAAWQRHAETLGAIARDAGERLLERLAADAGPPITTLRELNALWIDCGESAFADAAHGDAFAATQAELLAAYVELRALPAGPAAAAGRRP